MMLRPRQIAFSLGFLIFSVLFSIGAQAVEPRDPISNFLSFVSSNSLDYQFTDAPAPHSSDPTIIENRVRGNFIVSQTPTDTWSVHQSVNEFDLSHSPVIEPTGTSVPDSLWDVETGGAYKHHIGDRRDWGLSASIGSASDKLFNSIHETIFRATAMYHVPSREENSWLFFLSYSNNRHFANGIPLPGFAYLMHSEEHHLDAAVGLPFLAVSYRPTARVSTRLSIFGPENTSAEVGYRLWGPLQTYAGLDWGQQEWLRADRTDTSQRLFYDQKKWSLGMRFPLCDFLRIDLAAVYGFDRRFYEDTHAVNKDVADAELNPGWSGQLRLSTRW